VVVDPPGAFAPGTADALVDEVKSGACVMRLFFRARLVTLVGRLLDSDGEPDDSGDLILEPVGSEVRALRSDEENELKAETDDRGDFKFEVPPGLYRLRVRELGYLDAPYYPREIRLTDTPPAPIEFRLLARPKGSAKAVVVDREGRPVPDVKVALSGKMEDGAQIFGSIVTPASGRIEFTDLPLVEVELGVVAPAGCEIPPVKVQVGRSEQTKFILSCGR